MYARKALEMSYGVATLEDIKPGTRLWLVFGFPGLKIRELNVFAGPVTTPVMHAHKGYYLEKYTPYHFQPIWILGHDDEGNDYYKFVLGKEGIIVMGVTYGMVRVKFEETYCRAGVRINEALFLLDEIELANDYWDGVESYVI